MANFSGLQGPVQSALHNALAQLDKEGIKWSISSRGAFRTPADQQYLYTHPESHPGTPAARPGTSAHEQGLAADVNFPGMSSDQINRGMQILQSSGFGRPLPDRDPFHFVFGHKPGSSNAWWDTKNGPAPPILPPVAQTGIPIIGGQVGQQPWEETIPNQRVPSAPPQASDTLRNLIHGTIYGTTTPAMTKPAETPVLGQGFGQALANTGIPIFSGMAPPTTPKTGLQDLIHGIVYGPPK